MELPTNLCHPVCFIFLYLSENEIEPADGVDVYEKT